MTSSVFPEILLSLTIQCSMVLAIGLWLTRKSHCSEAADRLWGICHTIILVLVSAGVFLPHLRLLHAGDHDAVLSIISASDSIRSIALVLRAVWFTGAAVLTLRTVWSLIATSLIVRQTRAFPLVLKSGASRCSAETRTRLESAQITVLVFENLTTPFCWQLQHPVIVLPESLSDFPDDELDAVLRHELAHLEAQHPLKLFLQRLVEIVFWFHPLVWITSREASLQRELASDRRSNHSASEAAAFLRGMVRLADYCVSRTSTLVAGLGFGGDGRSILQRRVDHLLSLDWSVSFQPDFARGKTVLLICLAPLVAVIWIPLNDSATGRTVISPWPELSASVLRELGISVRDYEVDNHRLLEHTHRQEGL